MLALFDNLGTGELILCAVAGLLLFGRRLPEVAAQAGATLSKFRKGLDDAIHESGVEKEIRSTLEDMLDERKQGKGPADEMTIIQLLKEYGAPRDVAATYRPPQYQYLIGPRLFPLSRAHSR